MKYIKQFAIIMSVTFLGELIRSFINIPIPASIYGLLIMLLLLCSGALKYEAVKDAADFLVEIMPVMFIPGAVGLIGVWEELRVMLLPLLIIVPVTTWMVMIVSGRLTQALSSRMSSRMGSRRR